MAKGVILIEFDAPEDQFVLAQELTATMVKLGRLRDDDGFPPKAVIRCALYESAAAVLDEFHRREG